MPGVSNSFGLDDPVVVIGHGVGRVVSRDDGQLVVQLSEGEIGVADADADTLLRAVVTAAEAQAFVVRLCERCREERALPRLRSIRELTRAPLGRQVEYCRWYFRSKQALHPTERDMVLTTSEQVIAELAIALGVTERDVLAAVKRGAPELVVQDSRVLPAAPVLELCQLVRGFWLGSWALVGEFPERGGDVVEVSVKPGAWHAYLVQSELGAGRPAVGLLLQHVDLGGTQLASSATVELGGVNLEAGTIGVLCADALKDVTFGADGVERSRRDDDAYVDHGVEVMTWGDGDHRIFADADGAARCLVLPFGAAGIWPTASEQTKQRIRAPRAARG